MQLLKMLLMTGGNKYLLPMYSYFLEVIFVKFSFYTSYCFSWYILPLSLKAAISKVVLSQTFKTLTKFIEKNAKIYITKLISLDLS